MFNFHYLFWELSPFASPAHPLPPGGLVGSTTPHPQQWKKQSPEFSIAILLITFFTNLTFYSLVPLSFSVLMNERLLPTFCSIIYAPPLTVSPINLLRNLKVDPSLPPKYLY